MVNRLAVASGELDAGVAYYGRQVPAADVPKIKAALMLHYAENDEGVNAGIAAYEAALKASNIRHTIHIYPGTQHAFNNDARRRALQQGRRRPRLEPHRRVLQGAPRGAARDVSEFKSSLSSP
jgi:dienelactone hydrolase